MRIEPPGLLGIRRLGVLLVEELDVGHDSVDVLGLEDALPGDHARFGHPGVDHGADLVVGALGPELGIAEVARGVTRRGQLLSARAVGVVADHAILGEHRLAPVARAAKGEERATRPDANAL